MIERYRQMEGKRDRHINREWEKEIKKEKEGGRQTNKQTWKWVLRMRILKGAPRAENEGKNTYTDKKKKTTGKY